MIIDDEQLPQGYQQTKVEVIPEDWEVSLLVNLAEIRSGIAKNANTSVKNPVFVYYLRVANVQNGFLDLSEMSQLQVSHKDVKRYAVLPGDMLMNEGGDLDKLGRGTLWSGQFSPCIHQNHVFVVRCGSKLLPIYLNCWTGTRSARRYFMTAGKQTTNLASINKTSLGQLPIAHPSKIAEQRSIAQALSDVDALIASLDKAIAKKRHLKTATMQQLLTGKKRLPRFGERKGYQQTEVGVIPNDWNVVTIREITSLVTNGFVGKATDHYTDKDDGITYIQGYNVEANSFNFNGIKKVTSEFHRIHQKSCLKKDDLLTIQTGEVGLTTIVPDSLVGANCHALIISRFKKEKAYPWFYAHYFNSSIGRLRLRDLEVGTTMMHINVGELLPWEVPYPSRLEEQRAIATVLSDMDAAIAALETRLAKTQALKQGMMQALLTGRVRLV